MKIQQHDGVVVDAAGIRQGFAKPLRGERCSKGKGRRQDAGCGCPPSSPLYIGSPGGRRP